MLNSVPSMIARQLPQCIRNQRYLVWPGFQDKVNKFLFSWIAFNIEFSGDDFFDLVYIFVGDMSLIRPGVYGNPICTKTLGIDGRLYHIRIVSATAVAERGKFVDVNAEFCHGAKIRTRRELIVKN